MNEQVITGTIRVSKLSSTVYGGFAPYSDVTLIQKTITANGVYLPSTDNADGYSGVAVNVQSSDNNNFVIKESNDMLKYNKVYLGDVWAAYGYSYETPSNVEHIENGDFLTGSGSIWRMNNGVIQPTGMDNKRGMAFTQPITLTTETTLNIRCGYNSSSTYRSFWVSLFENADPSTIQPGGNGAGFGTGNLLQYINIVNWGGDSPTQAPQTVHTADVSALQGKTIWIHLFIIDVIPLITEIWFE